MAKKKMTEKEKQDWESLYMYVKSKIMGYDNDQALSKNMVLRLKGLLTNKFMENNNIEDTANYSYEVVLNSFKYSYPDIQRVFNSMNFVDETHKFNVVLKIVERNINTVYMKMKNVKRAKEEAKNIMVDIPVHTGAEFKPKEKKKDKFSDLW